MKIGTVAAQRIQRQARQRRLEQELERMISLLRAHGVQRVILFGSLARGDVRLGSDLDLIVVMDTDKRFLDRLDELYRLLDPRIAVDLLVYTPEEFARLRKTSPLVRRTVAEGKVLYAAGSEA
ncbi:MAG: nucleotidyltransferase domain-containing protein [Chloroflexota bacterium]|nr:nucleotidyltransferase domain-containing protein [Chloroflexota bacterium]